MRGLWSDLDKLVVTVEEDRFTVGGEEVYKAENRSDSLSFLFFKDGKHVDTVVGAVPKAVLTGKIQQHLA